MKQKIFFWTVKEYKNDYGTMYSLGIKKEDIEKLKFNKQWFANVSIKQSKNWNWYWEVYIPDNINNYENDQEDEMPF